jgi:hypothetical protein
VAAEKGVVEAGIMMSFDEIQDAIEVLNRARIEFEKLGYEVNIQKRLELREENKPSPLDQIYEFKLCAIKLPLLDGLSARKAEFKKDE